MLARPTVPLDLHFMFESRQQHSIWNFRDNWSAEAEQRESRVVLGARNANLHNTRTCTQIQCRTRRIRSKNESGGDRNNKEAQSSQVAASLAPRVRNSCTQIAESIWLCNRACIRVRGPAKRRTGASAGASLICSKSGGSCKKRRVLGPV
jgi:hypothetical protein